MSFSEEPSLTRGQKIGCIICGFVTLIIVINGLMFASLGHCAAEYHGSGCEYDGLIKFIMLPGSLIAAIVGGILLMKYMMKDRD